MTFNTIGASIIIVKNLPSLKIKKYTLGTIIEDLDKECKIEIERKTFKIEKKYIGVNLFDVMQKEVIYSITNASKSIYNIHENKIPKVTNQKLYTNITLNGKPFIPLMYETTKKLYNAEKEFLKHNLTIKIYDAYRPYAITKYLYNILLKLKDKYYNYLNGEINGNKYDETDFLASKTSTHNYMIAIDMTLVDLKTKKELKMQTKMHDLSIYSTTDYNNENAKLLSKIMTKQGFHPLESEWWHFQDDDSKIDYMNYYITNDNKIKEYKTDAPV